ncbi:MAG: GNAT family N-acetyltransferase [Lachnospiraceae bacterium]|nr:GNAT family N-acetyltransferase [Lachnospiraceae bacterium]
MTVITGIGRENIRYYLPLIPEYVLMEAATDENTEILGIESDQAAAGAIVLRVIPPEAEIIWYYLDPSFRGGGTGSESFLELLEMLKETEGIRYVTMDIPADAPPELKGLFAGYPAEYEKQSTVYFKTRVGVLHSSKPLQGTPKSTVSLKSLDEKLLRAFSNSLVQEHLDYIPMPIDRTKYMADMSGVFMEDGLPTGLLLIAKKGQELEIPFMANLSKNPVAIMDMMYFVCEKTKRFGEDTMISMNLVEEGMLKMIKALLRLEETEEAGFHRAERVVLSLGFLDEFESEAAEMIEELKQNFRSV